MPISISLSAIHPDTDKPCPQNQEGHYSDLIFMRAFDTLPQAQAELDQKAALSTHQELLEEQNARQGKA